MEAFDEALDRRIWSLADTRLQWHKRISRTRREVPKEIQSRLSDLFSKCQAQDFTVSDVKDVLSEDNEPVEGAPPVHNRVQSPRLSAHLDSVSVSPETMDEFQMTSAITEELDQVCRAVEFENRRLVTVL